MKTLLTIFCCFLLLTAFSQSLTFNQYEFLKIANRSNGIAINNFDNQYNDISGSSYFADNWLTGQAIMSTGKIYNNLRLKINLYQNKIYLNQNDTIYDISDVQQLKQIVLFPSGDTTQKAVFSSSLLLDGKHQLLQILDSGKVTFVKQDSRDLDEAQTGVNTAKEKMFTQKVKYFILKDNGSSEVKMSKKSLEKAFSEQEWNAILSYSNEKKLSLNNENDVAKAIHYLNNI